MAYLLNPEIGAVASPDLMQRGCVYIISLDKIRDRVGARWDRSKEAVWAHLESLLRQRLSSTDFFARIDETSTLVSLPSRKAQEAQICCLRIAHELHATMLGACDPSDLCVGRATALPDGTIGSIPVEATDPFAEGTGFMAEDATQRRPRGGRDLPADPISNCFSPVWDAQKEAITGYRCVTEFDSRTVSNRSRSEEFRFNLAATESRIRLATQMLSQSLDAGDRFLCWIPVSFDMMSAPVSRMEIAAICRDLPCLLRPYLVFEICDLVHGVPQSRLTELVASLRPFCRGVAAQLPARIANYGAYIGTGLHAIGLSLNAGDVSGPEMLSEIFKLGVAARRQGILSYVLDAPNEELLLCARNNGINLASSPLIGQSSCKPGRVRRLATCDIQKLAAA